MAFEHKVYTGILIGSSVVVYVACTLEYLQG